MSGKAQRFGTVVILLVAVALLGACGTPVSGGARLGPAFTATAPAMPTSQRIAAPPTAPPSPGPQIDFPLALGATWVFQLTRHEGVGIGEILTTTWLVQSGHRL